MSLSNWLFDETAPGSVFLVRVMVGWVFLSEGIQKFLYPAALGVGRFEKIGIPAPYFSAPFVGVVEIACGVLLIVGLLTRLAAIPPPDHLNDMEERSEFRPQTFASASSLSFSGEEGFHLSDSLRRWSVAFWRCSVRG